MFSGTAAWPKWARTRRASSCTSCPLSARCSRGCSWASASIYSTSGASRSSWRASRSPHAATPPFPSPARSDAMQLILWRHADAEDPGPRGDLARELTRKGREQAQAMADWLRPRLSGEWRVLCSPAARAIQTVTPLGRDYEVRPKLDPGHGARDYFAESG